MKKYLNQRGFTLIEIMIVLAIISILVLLIIPNAVNIIESANDKGCEAIEASETALELVEDLTEDDLTIERENRNRVCGEQ